MILQSNFYNIFTLITCNAISKNRILCIENPRFPRKALYWYILNLRDFKEISANFYDKLW